MAITDLDRITDAMDLTGPIEHMLWDQIDQPHAWDRIEQIAQQLESASCASGSWNGMIGTADILEKLSDSDWQDYINQALADWHYNTGEFYEAEDLESLVTFAVDQTAWNLACKLRRLDRVAVVTAAVDSMDPNPDVIAFDTVYEAEDWITEEVQNRVQYRVDHSPYTVTEEDLEEWTEEEYCNFTITEESI